jgi:hypothetical protein
MIGGITFWRDLLFFVVGWWCLTAAVTGNFYTGGRGGGMRPIAIVTSRIARVLFVWIGAGIAALVITDILRKVL